MNDKHMERASVSHATSRLLDALDRLFGKNKRFPSWKLTFGGAETEVIDGEKCKGVITVSVKPHCWSDESFLRCKMEIQQMTDVTFWRPSDCILFYKTEEEVIEWNFKVVEWSTKIILMPTDAESMKIYNRCLGHKL